MSMDQNLKQRLVGALVITSLAAIFIPMIFDDPVGNRGKMMDHMKIPDQPVASRDYMANPPDIKPKVNIVNLPETSYLQSEQETVVVVKEEEKKPVSDVKMNRWFVQVGIFGKEANAMSIRDKIRKQGFPVMVSTLSGEKGTLYRVMVGPELSKERAKEIQSKMDIINGLKGILISHVK